MDPFFSIVKLVAALIAAEFFRRSIDWLPTIDWPHSAQLDVIINNFVAS
jgi:hypothetical protein